MKNTNLKSFHVIWQVPLCLHGLFMQELSDIIPSKIVLLSNVTVPKGCGISTSVTCNGKNSTTIVREPLDICEPMMIFINKKIGFGIKI